MRKLKAHLNTRFSFPPLSTMSQQQPLPHGWISQWHEESRSYFYVDTRTGQSSWQLPVNKRVHHIPFPALLLGVLTPVFVVPARTALLTRPLVTSRSLSLNPTTCRRRRRPQTKLEEVSARFSILAYEKSRGARLIVSYISSAASGGHIAQTTRGTGEPAKDEVRRAFHHRSTLQADKMASQDNSELKEIKEIGKKALKWFKVRFCSFPLFLRQPFQLVAAPLSGPER